MIGGSGDPLSPPPFELEHAFKALTPSLHEGLSRLPERAGAGPGPRPAGPGPRRRLRGRRGPPELDQARALRDDSRRVIAALETQLAPKAACR
jgi:DNA mismatch repair protein MutS